MLAARVKLIEQSNVHRLAQDQLDHESKEEIFQHKMQAYDKYVFTPPTTDGVPVLRSANTLSRNENDFNHGRIYLQMCWNIISLEYSLEGLRLNSGISERRDAEFPPRAASIHFLHPSGLMVILRILWER